MAAKFQIVIDCTDPRVLVEFWSTALGYAPEPPPEGFDGWNAFWRSIGVPADELDADSDLGDSVVDAAGAGPRVWFQKVPETKTIKNRLHLDIAASGGRGLPLSERKELVLAEVDRLTAASAMVVRVLEQEGLDHFAVAMKDPEGNEFDIN